MRRAVLLSGRGDKTPLELFLAGVAGRWEIEEILGYGGRRGFALAPDVAASVELVEGE
jgi:hypothetical protein